MVLSFPGKDLYSHPEALSHGALVECGSVYLHQDLVEGPGFGHGVVAMTCGLLRHEAVQVKVRPWIDPRKVCNWC